MADNNQNLEGNVNVSDLSSISMNDSLGDINIDEVTTSTMDDSMVADFDELDQGKSIDGNVFLDSGEDEGAPKTQTLNKESDIGKYVRLTFISGIFIIIGLICIGLAYSFDFYIKNASKSTIDDPDTQKYVTRYRSTLGKIKELLGYNYIDTYQTPNGGGDAAQTAVNSIINASDLDYIDKKELLSSYVPNLSRDMGDDVNYIETVKERIAQQGFLPNELEKLLSEDQAIDTIQRSLNALEIIKFSTATKVFSYMNTALSTISEMIRSNDASVNNIRQLFEQLGAKGEKDIEAYVYMCYLNPFETNANCNRIGDLDLYYKRINEKSLDINLFKNTMNAISQLLEQEETTLFSITFNGFDAQAKNISFNVEVYVNQEDERALLAQGQRNPNIFISTNIINLLKQSRFIIGAEINTKDMNVETSTIDRWGLTRTVKYSNMEFSVPIQKNMEREIFDYINLDGVEELIKDRGLYEYREKESAVEKTETLIEEQEIDGNDTEVVEEDNMEDTEGETEENNVEELVEGEMEEDNMEDTEGEIEENNIEDAEGEIEENSVEENEIE